MNRLYIIESFNPISGRTFFVGTPDICAEEEPSFGWGRSAGQAHVFVTRELADKACALIAENVRKCGINSEIRVACIKIPNTLRIFTKKELQNFMFQIMGDLYLFEKNSTAAKKVDDAIAARFYDDPDDEPQPEQLGDELQTEQRKYME